MSDGDGQYETRCYRSLSQLWAYWRAVATYVLIQREVARAAILDARGMSAEEFTHLLAYMRDEASGHPAVFARLQRQFYQDWKLPRCWRPAFLDALEPEVDISFRSNMIFFAEKALRERDGGAEGPAHSML